MNHGLLARDIREAALIGFFLELVLFPVSLVFMHSMPEPYAITQGIGVAGEDTWLFLERLFRLSSGWGDPIRITADSNGQYSCSFCDRVSCDSIVSFILAVASHSTSLIIVALGQNS